MDNKTSNSAEQDVANTSFLAAWEIFVLSFFISSLLSSLFFWGDFNFFSWWFRWLVRLNKKKHYCLPQLVCDKKIQLVYIQMGYFSLQTGYLKLQSNRIGSIEE